MNRVLSKRFLRELREKLFRYIALGLLVAAGMTLVVSLAAAADTIIIGSNNKAEENKLEDGQFSVFVPFTEEQEKMLSDTGITLERIFSIDIKASDSSVLRVMKNRTGIDLIAVREGRTAEKMGEVLLEQRYCEENGINVGDTVEIGGIKLTVCGTGSVPDYDTPIANMYDSAAESKSFGLAFVTAEQYDGFYNISGRNPENLCYAYRLNGRLTHDELKKKIRDIDFDYAAYNDVFFKEMLADTVGKRDELLKGLKELDDGAGELKKGILELTENNGDVTSGIDEIFSGYLMMAEDTLSGAGVPVKLSEDNYADILDEYIELTGEGQLIELKAALDGINEYRNGINEYVNGASECAEGTSEVADGVSKLHNEAIEVIEEYIKVDVDNLTSFVKREDNPRILTAANDMVLYKQTALIAGVFIMILFTYVISVFVIHQVRKESSIIGALYAMGAKKKQLIAHYITLPTLVTLTGSVIGCVLGFSAPLIESQTVDSYRYYSFPECETVYSAWLMIYAVIMPPLVCAVVNALVINKSLSRTALSLIKNEQNMETGRQMKVSEHLGFMRRFQLRQIMRESRTGGAVIFGMIIALVIFMMGMDCYVMTEHIKQDNKSSVSYEYLYTLKYPPKNAPAGAEACLTETLSVSRYGYSSDITVFGIDGDNKYFDAKPEKGKGKLVIGKSVAEKYAVGVGDKIILTNKEEDTDYVFTVTGISDYSVGLPAFMDIASMRELFDEEEDYYNALISDKKLDIEQGRIYSVTERKDIERASEVLANILSQTIAILMGASLLIFIAVMYLMLNVMVDRASFGISLMKTFGFNEREVHIMYLNGNTITIAIGAIVGIPISKVIVDMFFPLMAANTAAGMDLSFSALQYGEIFIGIMMIYAVINLMLVGKLRKISPAEVLKNRE